MLTSIEFDDHQRVETGKVANIQANLMLPSEFVAIKLLPPKAGPEDTFSIGRIFPKCANV